MVFIAPMRWLILSDQQRRLLHQGQGVDIFEHPVVMPHPQDVLLRNAQQPAGPFLLGLANGGQLLAAHLQVVGALVIVGVDSDVDPVAVLGQARQRAAAAESIVARMRGEDQDRAAGPLLDRARPAGLKSGTSANSYIGHLMTKRSHRSPFEPRLYVLNQDFAWP